MKAENIKNMKEMEEKNTAKMQTVLKSLLSNNSFFYFSFSDLFHNFIICDSYIAAVLSHAYHRYSCTG